MRDLDFLTGLGTADILPAWVQSDRRFSVVLRAAENSVETRFYVDMGPVVISAAYYSRGISETQPATVLAVLTRLYEAVGEWIASGKGAIVVREKSPIQIRVEGRDNFRTGGAF